MSLSISLSGITFSDGASVSLDADSVVVIVGPNNAGKSSTLREIMSLVTGTSQGTHVVQGLNLHSSGSAEAFLEKMAPYRAAHSSDADPTYSIPNTYGTISASTLKHFWESLKTPHVSPSRLFEQFFNLADVHNRFKTVEPARAFNIITDIPTEPIQRLCTNEAAAEQLSRNFRRAFGQSLFVNRGAGRRLPLHCGEIPPLEQGEDRISPSYIRKVMKLPLLEQQGDGMRSFAGCLLQATVADSSVVLIDEPEAFLHPPQARLLGMLLAKQRPAGRQLIIATHSGDFLRGLLDATPSTIKIIRLTREADVNHARELDNQQIQELWNDPVLRFSNTLDGLFHEQVVLCEADGDCRFYAAVLETVLDDGTDRRHPAVMFTSTGGKSKMPTVAAALVGIGVPTRAVLDFDVLNAESPLRETIEALEGTWSAFNTNWRKVKASIEKRRPERETPHVRAEIEKILASVTTPTFPDVEAKRIQEILKRTSPWEEAKRVGLGAVPPGQERVMAEGLLAELKQLGLFVVDCGVLESFDPTVGGHGNAWAAEVLQKDLRNTPQLEQARKFVRGLVPA